MLIRRNKNRIRNLNPTLADRIRTIREQEKEQVIKDKINIKRLWK